MEDKLSWAEKALHEVKEKLSKTDDEVSEEVHEAVREAEGLLERGRAKAREFADASDDQFDEMWADAKHHWHDLAEGMEGHWDDLSSKVKRFFR